MYFDLAGPVLQSPLFQNPTLQTIVPLLLLLLLSILIAANAQRIARWSVGLGHAVGGRRAALSGERKQTLVRLATSLLSLLAVLIVIVGVLRFFVDSSQIVWIIGLFSAAFGLGARGLVADLIAGANYIFRNTFSIGEKIEFQVGAVRVEGVVEDVNMRSTLVRAPTGELFTVPNGEIGVIRNFTRGRFSGAQVKVRVPTQSLLPAVQTLQALGEQAMALFAEQIEPWQVLVTAEDMDTETEVTVNARFTFGNAAALKPRLAALIYEGLAGAGIQLPES